MNATIMRNTLGARLSSGIRRTGAAAAGGGAGCQRRSYHDNIVEHYENPRNVGSLDKKDKFVGTVRRDSSETAVLSQLSASILRGKEGRERLLYITSTAAVVGSWAVVRSWMLL